MINLPLRILLIGILLYLAFAIYHHKKDKSLTFPIFIEYLLTTILVLVIFMGVTI